jgi:hypothetical protein
MALASQNEPSAPTLNLSTESIAFIALKAKAFDAKEGDSDPDAGSNPSDDDQVDVLEDKPDDPVRSELIGYINALPEDEQVELVALAWLGRGTYSLDEWNDALETARNEHNRRTGQYLAGLPLLGDYLEEGLAAFGESIVDMDDEN